MRRRGSELASLGEALDKSLGVARELRQLGDFERLLACGAHQVAKLDGGVGRIHGGLLHDLSEERRRVLDVVLIERIVARDEHDDRLAVCPTAERTGVTAFPFLSDWGRDVTRAYGLFGEKSVYARRGTFVVDKDGKIQQIVIDNAAVDPTSTADFCSLMEKKLVVAPPKP